MSRRLLLDTHTFIWFIQGNPKLSVGARSLIEDVGNDKLLSVASAWEMHIKERLGRLPVGRPLADLIPEQIEKNGFTLLSLELRHLAPISTLPLHHGDPFDRLLIAQALVEGVPLVSGDTAFDSYAGLERLW